MVFHNPWGLLALLAIPAIVTLHFFRDRRRVRRVGGLHLWQFARIRMPIGRRWQRLIRSLSLLFQILAALLLALLIAGVDRPLRTSSLHYTIVLDDTVSMQARQDDSAAERARGVIQSWARDEDKFTLIAAGARPRLLAGPFADRTALVEALDRWMPQSPSLVLESAVDLAGKFTAGEAKALYVTDDEAPSRAFGESLEVYAVGHKLENVAIDFADRFRATPEKDRFHVTLQSYALIDREATLRAWMGETEIFSQVVNLEPGRPISLGFETAQIEAPVRLTIDEDALVADNSAILSPVAIKSVRVAAAGFNDSVNEYMKRAIVAVPYTAMIDDPAAAHLVLSASPTDADRTTPWRVCLFPDSAKVPNPRVVQGRDIVVDHKHRLTSGVTVEGLIWPYRDDGPTTESNSRVLMSHGGHALLSMTARPAGRGLWRLNLLADRTNIFRHPAWPVLVQGLVEECREAMPGIVRTNLRVGEPISLRLPPDIDEAAPFQLLREGRPFAQYDEAIEEIPELPAGQYALRDRDARSLASFSVNLFAPGESDLRAMSSHEGDLDQLIPEALRRTETNRPLFFILILSMIGLMALSWVFQDTSR